MRALIIDDSAVMRKVVERALRQAGIDLIEVFQASDGAEALDVLRSVPSIGLIMCDINMPGMDGMQFLEQKLKDGLALDTPVVMITTEANEVLVRRVIAAGARGYICKPFTPDQVKARVVPLLISAANRPNA